MQKLRAGAISPRNQAPMRPVYYTNGAIPTYKVSLPKREVRDVSIFKAVIVPNAKWRHGCCWLF